jgi:ABC-type lipoprotein export system ATPase subunit
MLTPINSSAEELELAILVASNIWKSYVEEQFVLKNVQLTLEEAEFASIQGRSGAGKSTLLRIAGLLEKTDRGELHLFGQATNDLNEKQRAKLRLEKIGFVFQSLNLIPHITATENIEVPLWLKKVNAPKRKERALDLLNNFGLKNLADRFPHQMSLGEQQRVAVLRALANEPPLILADEPTAHLDEDNAAILFDLLKQLNKEFGTSILMTTTNIEESDVARTRYRLSRGTLEVKE